MTYEEFEAKVREVLPEADILEDNEGQLVVYTNFQMKNGEVVKFDIE